MSIVGVENAIMGTVIKHIGNKFFGTHKKIVRFDLWMKHLRVDININKCIKSFEEIISQETWSKFHNILQQLGLILPIIFFITINKISENPLTDFIYVSLFFIIIISILIFIILPHLVDKINQTNILVKARITEIRILTAKFFIFNSISLNILILLFLPFQESQTSSGVKIIEGTVSILIFVFVVSMVFIEIFHSNFLDKVKTLLNAQHLADFPFIHIKTKEADFAGIIQDVFNKNLLILDDNGRKTIVEWNEITTMELLKEESEIDHSPPPSSKKNP